MARKILFCVLAALALACGRDERQPDAREPALEVTATDTSKPAVLFLGTSLTAGMGLSSDEAYPALIQSKIDSAGLGFRVVNAGVSGETSAGGLRRIDWLLRQPLAVLVLELGANDMLRGQDIPAMRTNLQEIIDRTRAAHPDAAIVIAGMRAAPNLGEAYVGEFEAVFPELAEANGATLIPFLLEGVAGVPELNQPDGNHPTAEGQAIVAENVWTVLGSILRELDGRGESDSVPD
ncbi:MAG: arylesterase [Gemmatimonadota bacterium]|nr:MAG: arylesterase [Gemmatimonadota bacterium]